MSLLSGIFFCIKSTLLCKVYVSLKVKEGRTTRGTRGAGGGIAVGKEAQFTRYEYYFFSSSLFLSKI